MKILLASKEKTQIRFMYRYELPESEWKDIILPKVADVGVFCIYIYRGQGRAAKLNFIIISP